MKKVFLLSLFLVFSASQSSAADYFAVKLRQVDMTTWEYDLYMVNTTNSTETLIGLIPNSRSAGFSASGSFVDKNTGELFVPQGSKDLFYNPETNTWREIVEDPLLSGYSTNYEIPDIVLDDMISVTSEDAEIKIDETNNTVNIDNAAISDGDGKNIIAVKNDGAVHIGENSLVTVEQNGRQYLYGTDASGSMIDIDIKSGSDFRIHGISVLDSLRGLGDGVEGSAALTAALSSVPSSAPDYEYYCGGGLGAYGSSQAAALGCAKDHSETLSFHAGASYLLGGGEAYGVDKFSDFAFKAGFTYKFGKKSKSNPVETASLNATALSASSKVEQTKLKAQVNDLSHKLAMMEKKLEVITASMDLGSHMDKVAMAR